MTIFSNTVLTLFILLSGLHPAPIPCQTSVQNKPVPLSECPLEEQLETYNRFFDLFFFDAIEASMHNAYDTDRQYHKFKILDLTTRHFPTPTKYYFKVKFETFTGAHSEPFDENIAVYEVILTPKLTIEEVSFEHYPVKYPEETYIPEISN